MILQLILFPVNLYRLIQFQRLVRELEAAQVPVLRNRGARGDPRRAWPYSAQSRALAERRACSPRRKPQLESRRPGEDVADAAAAPAQAPPCGGDGLFLFEQIARLVRRQHRRHHSGEAQQRQGRRQPAASRRAGARPRQDPGDLPGRHARRARDAASVQERHRPSRQSASERAGAAGIHARPRQGVAARLSSARASTSWSASASRSTARSPTMLSFRNSKLPWRHSLRRRSYRCGNSRLSWRGD